MPARTRSFCISLAGLCCLLLNHVGEAAMPTAHEIYDATGVQGGFVVHIGCDDGLLTRALRMNDRYLVQGLERDPAKVAQARKNLQAESVYGSVTVRAFDGRHLPYVRDMVNLLVASNLGDVSMDEVHRVLAPHGVAYIQHGDTWQKTVEPRPDDIDEWTHFLHDAGGNAVANDSEIGPPKSLRWVAGPRWCRSHEIPSSVGDVVMSDGRIFSILDEGPTGVFQGLPQQCRLIARDAANGVLLWKVPLREWQPEFGTGVGNRWNIHHTIPRRLIAQGDRVYVTLQFLHSPVSVLDAATGKTLVDALPGTEGTDEMILSDGILIAKTTKERSVGATERIQRDSLHDRLVAVDVGTGKQLWEKPNIRVIPYALSAADGRVVYHNFDGLVCLDAKTGNEDWSVAMPISVTVGGGSTLVLSDGVVLFHGHGKPVNEADTKQNTPPAKSSKKQPRKPQLKAYLTAMTAKDGRVLWQVPGSRPTAGACTQPTDVFVAKGIVWCGNSLKGRDLRTGEVKKELTIGELISPGHHYRCHRGKATERFMIWPKRGAEFLDLEGDQHMRNDWLRAPCFTGLTPANGLLYVPPSQCFCYPGVKVSGFNAMSAQIPAKVEPATEKQLEKGPAYHDTKGTPATAQDWPMHRGNIQRSGSTKATIGTQLKTAWEIPLAAQGSQPIVVKDRLWLAEKDAQRIRCFDATTGQAIWSFTAGGRVDSSPTYHNGSLLFGCRDGSVYCLRASDGVLAWRLRAAPDDRQLVSYEQVESVWPIHGSLLVQNDVAYFAAGRSSFLDGGLMAYGVDVNTGSVLYSHLLEGPWPDVKTETGAPFAMEGALPDLLVSDGDDLYMRRIKFDAHLNRLPTQQESSLGELNMGQDHLVATGGFLDDTGFDRLFWMHGKRWPGFYFSQHAPKSGQLVVFDETTTYAVKYFYRRIVWSPAFIPGDKGYLLFADRNDNEPALEEKGSPVKAIEWLPPEAATDKYRRGGRGVEKGTGYIRQSPAKWQHMVPLRIRAMVLAGEYLYAVGTPDILDPDDPLAALEGRKGELLQVFSAQDGSLVASRPLKSLPAFDALSAANGRLYLSTRDNKVLCFQ